MKESGKRLAAASELGCDAARRPQALKKRSQTIDRHRDAIRQWHPSELPDWLDDGVYTTQIQPALDRVSKIAIAKALGVSKDYAYEIARARKIPHRRHWVKLAKLVGIMPDRAD